MREQPIHAMRAYFAAGRSEVDPWQLLDAEQKADALKRLLEEAVADALPALVGGK